MPNIKMLDTTSHANYGSMKEGEVIMVSEEDAAHLIGIGLAEAGPASKGRARASTAPSPEETPAQPPDDTV